MEKIIKFLQYIKANTLDLNIVFYDLSNNEIPANYILVKPVQSFIGYGMVETYILLFYFHYQDDSKMLYDFNMLMSVVSVDKQIISHDNVEFIIQEISSINIDRGEISFNVKIAFK